MAYDPRRYPSPPAGSNYFNSGSGPNYTNPAQYAPISSSSNRTDDPLAAAALLIANSINKTLIAHPCTVLRHQCQVHYRAKRLHLTPVTLAPVVVHMVNKDGIQTLWRGSIGCGVLSVMNYVVEVIIGDVFGLPRTIVPNGSRDKFWKHLILKGSTCFVTTTFIISSFIETVRSGSSLTESNGLEIFYRGFERLRSDLFGAKDAGRRLPVFYLAVPTTLYYVIHYLVSRWAYNKVYSMARKYVLRKPVESRTRFHSILPEMFATMTSSLMADLTMYPFETVLHRLYIQGTRTLIDNLDTGIAAVSVSVRYSGFFDCFSSIIKHEGYAALYAGIGGIALQYCLQFCVFRGFRILFDYITSPVKPQVNVAHPLRSSGPNSNVGNSAPSAQFAAVETPVSNNIGSSPKKPHFPTFAQTAASMDVMPPLGPLHNNFNDTSNIMGSSSPPIYRHSPVKNDLLLSMRQPSPTDSSSDPAEF